MISSNQEEEVPPVPGQEDKSDKPAEQCEQLFRKDLISAMKLPDQTQLADNSYYLITDSWRMDWEKSVQVPVLEQERFKAIKYAKRLSRTEKIKFSLPNKYLHACQDSTYRKSDHQLYDCHRIDPGCSRYDLDETDTSWLRSFNIQRNTQGMPEMHDNQMELIIERIEDICSETMQTKIKTVAGLGIEYDENIVCDICRSPDSEDTNEMVFCDKCDVCVHQACYGIQKIPTGSWLCRVCVLGIKAPKCILCPNLGGAYKTTPSGNSWAHVSCALWIPEVSFACADKMEPIINIALIPDVGDISSESEHITTRNVLGGRRRAIVGTARGRAIDVGDISSESEHITTRNVLGGRRRAIEGTARGRATMNRWALNCVICREKNAGACIQCAIRPCNVAFHVTCAIRHKLLMQTMVDLNTDDVRFKAYCSKHTKILNAAPTKPIPGQSIIDNSRDHAKICNEELTVEQIDERRAQKLDQLAKEFYLCVNRVQLQTALANYEPDIIDPVFAYWKLKRRANFDKALLPPLVDTIDEDRQEELNLIARVKMFIHLRQDLERVRNLCYMVSRREKLSRQYLLTILDEFKARRNLWDLKPKPLKRKSKPMIKVTEEFQHNHDDDFVKPLPLQILPTMMTTTEDHQDIDAGSEETSVVVVDILEPHIDDHNSPDPDLSTKKQRKRRRIEDDIDSILLDRAKTSTLYDLHESIMEQVRREDEKKALEELELADSGVSTQLPRCVKQCIKRMVHAPQQPDADGTLPSSLPSTLLPAKALTVRKYKQQNNGVRCDVIPSNSDTSLPGAAKKFILDAYERSNVRASHSKLVKEPKKKVDPAVSSIRQNAQNSISDFFRRTINQK